jgi:hypothetical protein
MTDVVQLAWTEPAALNDPHGVLRTARAQHWYAANAFGVTILRYELVHKLLSD